MGGWGTGRAVLAERCRPFAWLTRSSPSPPQSFLQSHFSPINILFQTQVRREPRGWEVSPGLQEQTHTVGRPTSTGDAEPGGRGCAGALPGSHGTGTDGQHACRSEPRVPKHREERTSRRPRGRGAVPASQGVCAEQCGEFGEALAEHTCSWPFLDFRSRDLGRHVRTAPGHTCLPAWDSPGRNGAKRRGASTGLARGASPETPPQSARRGAGVPCTKNSNYAAASGGRLCPPGCGSRVGGRSTGRPPGTPRASLELLSPPATVWNLPRSFTSLPAPHGVSGP